MLNNKKLHHLLIISSAVLYGVAYLCPHFLWWTMLIFLVPLFYLVLRDTLTLQDGLVWSTLSFSLHLSGVLEGLFLTAEPSMVMRFVPALLMLCAAIVYGSVWFAVSILLCVVIVSRLQRLLVWVATTSLFFLFLERGCLFMLGVWEGYLLCNPLVPLVQFPALLYFLPRIGSGMLLSMLVITQAVIAYALHKRKAWIFLVFCGAFWLGGIVLWYRDPINKRDTSTIVCGNAYFKQQDNITYGGRIIRDYCKALIKKYPATQVIFFPETAFRCPLLPGEPTIVQLFNKDEIGSPVTIITGGFRWDNGIYRNTVYLIVNGKVIDIFDKRHAMALTERAPTEYLLGSCALITENYFKEFVGIVPNSNKRPVWKIGHDFTIIPYICSELFFNNTPDQQDAHQAILVALCNDNWLARDYMRWQMVMGARYRAIQWQIPILYVAHFYQVYCGAHGEYQPLQVFDHTKDA